jgi:hypothetical protein
MKHLNRTDNIILNNKQSLSSKKCHARNMRGRPSFIEGCIQRQKTEKT